jgi:hypothetical protein
MQFISAIYFEVVAVFLFILVNQNVDFYIAMFTVVLTAFWREACRMRAT